MMTKIHKYHDRIIDVIISSYVEKGTPVSSSHIAENSGVIISPATVRNVMKELENEGFLTKPHASAGRIPTVKCYRYYVQRLMKDVDLTDDDYHTITRLIENVIRENDADVFMDYIAKVISEITDLIGVIMSPLFDSGIFDRLEIMNLGGSQYLLIISLQGGLVKTINLRVNQVIPRAKVEETARLLSGRLHGLTIAEIKRSIGKRIRNIKGGHPQLFEVILNNQEQIFNMFEDKDVHLAGLSRFLSHPDFVSGDYSPKLAGLFENKREIAEALVTTIMDEEDVNIRIGGIGLWGSNPPLSVVSAVYRSSGMPGAIAVIGPTRIQYPKLRAIMKYTAAVTSRFFSS